MSGSQHAEVALNPGSHSSPSSVSTIPLPHCCREIVVRDPGSTKHESWMALFPSNEQMLPTEQGEKLVSVDEVVGFMM